jgi:pyruvate carboxylase
MNKYTTISNLKTETRKEARTLLLKQLEHRKRQLKLFDELLIRPIKHNIELITEVLSNKECLERYVLSSKNIHKTLTLLNLVEDKNEKK